MYTNTRGFLPAYINCIDKDETYHGLWWLPSNPEDKVAGVLYLRPKGGAKLVLIGSFKNEFAHGPDHIFVEHEVITGQIVPGGHIMTLVDCKEYEWKSPMFQVSKATSTQKFRIDNLVFSLQTESTPKFQGFEFATTYLLDWVAPDLVDSNFDFKAPVLTGAAPKKVSFKYRNATIDINSWVSPNFNHYKEALPQQASISIELEHEITVRQFREEYQRPIVNLIQFATSHLNSVTFLKVTPKGAKDSIRVVDTNEFDQITHASESIVHHLLFRLDDLTDDISTFIVNWLDAHSTFQHIFSLYFGSRQVKHQFPVLQFLNLIQALESFHYERESTPLLSSEKEQFNNRKLTIMNKIQSSEDLDWLKTNLNYHTQLRVRLVELHSEATGSLADLVGDSNVFIKRLVDSRNYYTHYNPKLKAKAAVGDELFALIYILRIWLDFHFMNKCGIKPEKCSELIKRNSFYDSVKSITKQNKYWQTPRHQ
jgi:hypothetical protein